MRNDRTGVGTKAVFAGQLDFYCNHMIIPLVTIKKTLWKKAFIEMLWFLRGENNTKFLKENGVNIWDEWADKDGNLGPIYGVQWRNWQGIDQIANLIHGIKTNPMGRRHIVTAWNPADIDKMGLPPCHYTFQCYVTGRENLNMILSIRSWDLGLGAPFNIAQYGFLLHLLAQCTGLNAKRLTINYGDAHIYNNHIKELFYLVHTKNPMPDTARLVIKNPTTNIDEFTIDDFDVVNYVSHEHLPLPVAV